MPRKAPRKPPIGDDWSPFPPSPRPLPRKAAPKQPKPPMRSGTKKINAGPKIAIRSGTKKINAGPKIAKRTAPRPTRGYR